MIASPDLPRAAEDGTSPGSDGSANALRRMAFSSYPCATRSCSREPCSP